MQSRHVPFFFCTRSGLESHLGHLMATMKPASSSRFTSMAVAFRRSSFIGRSVCLTGRALGSTCNLCSASSLGTPGMSEGFHAKMSPFSRRNSMSALSYACVNPVPMTTQWEESPSLSSTRRVDSEASNVAGAELGVVGFFRIEGSFESTPEVYLASASCLFSSSAMMVSAIRPPSDSHSRAIGAWDLHDVVGVVRGGHEFGECLPSKYAVIRAA